VNVEVAEGKNEGDTCPRCNGSNLLKARASEVGNVFDLGQKYGKDFDLGFLDRNGQKQFPVMGCYGIGISRAMGVIVEKFNDERGIIWPEEVAPFQVYLISIGKDEEANALYEELKQKGVEVLFDDRDKNPGEKFGDCDLLGIPMRIVLSGKLEEGMVEVKKRTESDVLILSKEKLMNLLISYNN
jgi:prolyl-tRNA synthetase